MTAIWYVGAVLCGFAFGVIIAATYRRLLPSGTTGRFIDEITSAVQGLLFEDADDFWQHYRKAIRKTFQYVARQLVTLVSAFLPLVVAVLVAGPLIWAHWDASGTRIVHPAAAGTLRAALTENGSGGGESILELANGPDIQIPTRPGSLALCAPDASLCRALVGLGFSVEVEPAIENAEFTTIIVRSNHDDWNPLWPYLNDPEFLFFLSLFVTSLGGMILRGRKGSVEQSSLGIGGFDFLMTQFATRNRSAMIRLGETETKLWRRKLDRISIDRPIFIAGLARSGTTILLEKLASLEGVATHRYRDFPFVMTPIFWNWIVSVFGRTQDAVERPHGDSIRITRDSPDAFEEPIWQFFFPHIHDPSQCQKLDETAVNTEFEDFFAEHIRKILYIRKGRRYASKGNYNLTRIPYLAKLFPDARFLVPVRHPVSHVESLMRQHARFLNYSKHDSRIGEYLRAAGHYEFGPQRLPINVYEDGAKKALQHWKRGEEEAGYAQQWADVYSFVLRCCRQDSDLESRIKLIRFEDLVSSAEIELKSILEFVSLSDGAQITELASDIRIPGVKGRPSAVKEGFQSWNVVAKVAAELGYTETAIAPADDQRVRALDELDAR